MALEIPPPEMSAPTSLEALAAATADPRAVFDGLACFRRNHEETPELLAVLECALADPLWRRRVVSVLGNSPHLTRTLLRWPEFLEDLMEHGVGEQRQEAWRARLLEQGQEAAGDKEIAALMRRHKHRAFLRIGMLDLTGEASLEQTTGGLTRVAEDCLEAGYRWLYRQLERRFGAPMARREDGSTHPARFVILGMGKLGAGELNYSSDIDLIYLYEQDNGETNGQNSISIKDFYSRIGRDLMRLMQEKTAEGMVFRTDLRLRPEGESGDLCLSCRSAEIYYESWGRTWERAAMIKARPVAGDLELGEEFLTRLQPFIYRRYLDFASLDAIREMKRKIDNKMALAADYQRNIKLGYGGIREIEFFVQCQQLIHGGKVPRLRARGTVQNLQTLRELSLLEERACAFLLEAYPFLRDVEHKLQIEQEQQTHSLPDTAEALERLARRMRLPDAPTLTRRLKEVRDRVNAIYGDLFFSRGKEEASPGDALVNALVYCDPDQDTCLVPLQQAGFHHPEQARGILRILRAGPKGVGLRESTQLWYDRLAPLLMKEILHAPDHDMALQHAESFLQRIGHRTSYLAMLVEYPRVLSLLVKLFGTSVYLSRFLIAHPELLDHLVTRDFLDHYRNRADLSRDLARLLEEKKDPEERMDALRTFKNTEVLRIGIRDISRIADISEAMAGLSALADTLLTQVMTDALVELEARHGKPCWTDDEGHTHPAPFAILAMGKLGGNELSYASDLDLIFVHGGSGPEQWTDGKHSLSNTQYFAKLGQKIITGITTVTRAGKLYELDMRLRPSGNSGPVVTSFEAFHTYHRNEAWTWEHQALTRARVVVGDAELVRQLREEIQAILTLRRDPETVRQEVAEMRLRMYHEKRPPDGVLDIKQSRGGVVDVEFLIQYLILAHAAAHPQIARREAVSALHAFRAAGLITPEELAVLDDAYPFYRMVESRLRLTLDRSENRIGQDAQVLERLERLCDLEGDERLPVVLEHHLAAVVPIYRRHFGDCS